MTKYKKLQIDNWNQSSHLVLETDPFSSYDSLRSTKNMISILEALNYEPLWYFCHDNRYCGALCSTLSVSYMVVVDLE